jgi:Na+-translocating ferredoxin:NAD+ oxidoreductase RnfC subunit
MPILSLVELLLECGKCDTTCYLIIPPLDDRKEQHTSPIENKECKQEQCESNSDRIESQKWILEISQWKYKLASVSSVCHLKKRNF